MKTIQLTALGLTAALLVSCDPLPPYPPPRDYRPYGSERDRRELDGRYPDQRQDQRYGQQQNPYAQPRDSYDRPSEPAPNREQYPTAQTTANPNQVLSPYAPYNVIDVEGFKSGQLAKDPSNQKIFRVP